MKTILFLLFWTISSTCLFSQTTLQGKVTDAESGEPIIFGTVAIYKNDVLITGTETDFDGFYSITELDSGKYDVVFSYTGYQDYKVVDVVVNKGKANQLVVKISAGGMIFSCPYIISCRFRPLISNDETTQGFRFDSHQISRTAH